MKGLTLCLLVAALVCCLCPGQAQSASSIGLYTDLYRTTHVAQYSGALTEFTMYVFILPGGDGASAAEFAVSYPANVLPGAVEANPLVQTQLGDLASGMTVGFNGCQLGWTWTHRQQIFLVDTSQTWITAAPHGATGAMILATCAAGYPLEPMTAISAVGCNIVLPPDTEPPTLLEAAAIDLSNVELVFSEALIELSAEDVANYEVREGGPTYNELPIGGADLDASGTTVTLHLNVSLFEGRPYIVRVHGVSDYAGNEIAPGTVRAIAAPDYTPPHLVEASAPNDSTVFAAFDEPLDEASAEDPANYQVVDVHGSPCPSTLHLATLVSPDTVRLDYRNPKLPTLVQLTLIARNISDLAGNVIGLGNGVNFIVPDLNPPHLAWVQALSPTTVKAQFNKDVTAATALNPANYEIFERDDTLATVPVTGIAAINSQLVQLTLGAPLAAFLTPYVLRVRNIEDADGRIMEGAASIEFIYSDTAPPEARSVTMLSRTLLEISFNEDLDEASAEAVGNYSLTENWPPDRQVPITGAELMEDARTVRLSLAWAMSYGYSYFFSIYGVEDIWGNAMTRAYFELNFPDIYPPVLTTVTTPGPRILDLTFDEILVVASSEEESNYSLTETADPGHAVPIALAALQASGMRVRLSLAENMRQGREYAIVAGNLSDRAGNVMPAPASRTFIYNDASAPTLTSATATGPTSVRVGFSEQLETVSAEQAANYQIFETIVPAHTVPVTAAALLADSASVLLSLGGTLQFLGYTVRVNNVADRAGNAIVSNSTIAFSVPDTLPPVLTGVTAPSSRVLDCSFDEKLLRTPAETEANYSVFETANPSRAVGVTLATLASSETQVRLSVASDLVSGRSYTLVVTALADTKGNVIPAPGSSFAFMYVDTTPPQLLSAVGVTSTSVRAVFSEKLDPGTAQAPANYLLFERYAPSRTTAVTAAALEPDSTSVLLTLGAAIAQLNYALRVNAVADRAGNPVAANSTVYFLGPDFAPPQISSASSDTRWNVAVVFNECVEDSSASRPANYRVVAASSPYDEIACVSAARGEDCKTVALSLASALTRGMGYRLLVGGVRDYAGNAIAPWLERSFTCPATSPSAGIGLYIDAVHGMNTVQTTSAWTTFTMYVWCRPSDYGLTGAQFGITYPQAVIVGNLEWNMAVLASVSGSLSSYVDLSTAGCLGGWTWVCRQVCWYMSTYGPATVSVSASQPPTGRRFNTCDPLHSPEMPAVLSNVLCRTATIGILLESSAASWKDGVVEVAWRLSEMEPGVTFSVSRAEDGEDVWRALSGAIEANGLSFSYRDALVEPGAIYAYRVEYTDGAGAHLLFESNRVTVPARALALEQNRPNPFNPSTTIDYYLPTAGRVELAVYDISGRLVAQLDGGTKELGPHSAVWNGLDQSGQPAASGIYICRLIAGKETLTRKMILLR